MRFKQSNRSQAALTWPGSSRRRRRHLTPRLEALEVRATPSTLTVSSAMDDGSAGTLRAKIAAAKSGDTIAFLSKLAGQPIHLSKGELAVTKSLTIQGPAGGLVVDGGGQSRVFDITAAHAVVTISGLTITGGGNVESGAGILVQGGKLTLNNDNVINNHARGLKPGHSAEGGGVRLYTGASLTVIGGQFGWNTARGADGGKGPQSNGQGGDGMGGAIDADDLSSITIAGASFVQNTALGGDGGSGTGGGSWNSGGGGYGGAINTSGKSLVVTSTQFSLDRAQGGDGSNFEGPPNSSSNSGGWAEGGGIAILASSAPRLVISAAGLISQSQAGPQTVTLTRDGFQYETAAGGRGGINDSVDNGTVLNGDGGAAFGGAIYNSSVVTALSIRNSALSGNLVQGGQGGDGDVLSDGPAGGAVGGAAVASFGDLSLSRSTLSSNSAVGGSGDGIAPGLGGAGGMVFGGVVFVNGNLSVAGTRVEDNLAEGGIGGAGVYGGAGGSVIGGAIDSQAGGVDDAAPFPGSSIATSQFTNNVALGGWGGYAMSINPGAGGFVWGGDVCAYGNMAISDSGFTGSRAQGGHGGDAPVGAVLNGRTSIGAQGLGGSTRPRGIVFDGATGGAGGLALGGSLALLNNLIMDGGATDVSDSLTNVTIQGATAQGGAGGGSFQGGPGGAAEGGGIALSVRSNNPSGHLSVKVSDTTIENNSATGGAGGWSGGGGSLSGSGGDGHGGGLFVDVSATVALQKGSITGNQANGGVYLPAPGLDGQGIGGGVYLAALGSTKKKTTISGNFASTSKDEVFGKFS